MLINTVKNFILESNKLLLAIFYIITSIFVFYTNIFAIPDNIFTESLCNIMVIIDKAGIVIAIVGTTIVAIRTIGGGLDIKTAALYIIGIIFIVKAPEVIEFVSGVENIKTLLGCPS
ncbi:MAG: TrbC/VirB2 family protein [Rickettsiales bacterium]